MGELTKLPNISRVTEEKLRTAGVLTPDQLMEIGSREAFVRIRKNDPTACIHMLYGLEGAVRGVRDTCLSDETKNELKLFFRAL